MKEIIALDFKLRSYTRTLKRLNGGIRIFDFVFYFSKIRFATSGTVMKSFRSFPAGMLLRKIVEDIQSYKTGRLEPSERNAFLFSAHEVNVAAVAKVLDLDEPVIPAYGSTIILETLRDKKRTYYVRVSVQ